MPLDTLDTNQQAQSLAVIVLAQIIRAVFSQPGGTPYPSDSTTPQEVAAQWVEQKKEGHQEDIRDMAKSETKYANGPFYQALGPDCLDKLSNKTPTYLQAIRGTKDISTDSVTRFIHAIYTYFLYEVETHKEEIQILLNNAYVATRTRDTNKIAQMMIDVLNADNQQFFQSTMEIEQNKRYREEQPKREVIPPANLKREFDEVASPHNLRPRDSKRQRKA